MLDLSPTKLLIIFVVVVVLLGPKRLPEVARQLGAGWRKLRELHLQVDRELRQSLPDLPSSRDIVRFARSPVSLLDQLADRHGGVGSPDGKAPGPPEGREPGSPDGSEPGSTDNGEPASVDDGEPGSTDRGGPAAGELGAPVDGLESETAAGRIPAPGVPALAGLDADDPNLN